MKPIDSNHPLTRSKWLWPEGNVYLQNCFAEFRHDFELTAIPESAPLFLTADQSYRLWINGQSVCRGPARGYQSHWPFDEVEVRKFLRIGHNWISVEAYNPGIGTFQYLHCDDAGFLCAAEWSNRAAIHTNKATWRMRRAPGNKPYVARLSRQMGFQEDFDAAKDDRSWIDSPEAPDWSEPAMFRWSGETAFGRLPWATLEERGIPLLRQETIAPERISVHGFGNMQSGWKDCFNIAWQWMEKEVHSVTKWIPGEEITSLRDDSGFVFEAGPAGPDRFHAVVLDLGAIRTGTFRVEASGCTGEEIIDCLYFQYLENGVPVDLLPVGNGGLLALATRLRTAPGCCGREFHQLQGARYIVLVLRGLTRPLKLATSWRTAEYPFSMRGRFETSDPQLDAIYRLCRHTQQICSVDAYIDTPWREQGQWWGDARVQAKNTFFLDGDSRLFRRGIASIAGQETSCGLTYGVAPCCCGGCILPDFSLTWVLTVFDYWRQTGDLSVFKEQHGRIRRVFDYFHSPEACREDGLLKADPRFWLFEDWAPLPKTGFPAFLNLWHLYTLQHYRELLLAANLDDTEVSREIESRNYLILNCFFDSESGLFRSGLTLDGTPLNDSPSLHDRVLAILCGLKPELHRAMAEKRLLPFLRGEKTGYAVPTSFWCTYLFDAADQLGYRQEVVDFIRSGWGKMIPSGGTWEHFIWNRDDGQSCCHAWSAHPASHLAEILGGLRQTAAAWRRVEWNPLVPQEMTDATVSIPTPSGMLSSTWERDAETIRFGIDIPAGMTVGAKLPGLPPHCLTAGQHHFETAVTKQPVMV